MDYADFSNVPEESLKDIEADVMWTLSAIFKKGLQEHYTGSPISSIRKLTEMVKVLDEPLFEHLNSCDVQFLTFAYTWTLTLLIKEFRKLPLVISLWDKYLACGASFSDFHIVVCAHLLTHFSEQIRKLNDPPHILAFVYEIEDIKKWNFSDIEKFTATCKLTAMEKKIIVQSWMNVSLTKKVRISLTSSESIEITNSTIAQEKQSQDESKDNHAQEKPHEAKDNNTQEKHPHEESKDNKAPENQLQETLKDNKSQEKQPHEVTNDNNTQEKHPHESKDNEAPENQLQETLKDNKAPEKHPHEESKDNKAPENQLQEKQPFEVTKDNTGQEIQPHEVKDNKAPTHEEPKDSISQDKHEKQTQDNNTTAEKQTQEEGKTLDNQLQVIPKDNRSQEKQPQEDPENKVVVTSEGTVEKSEEERLPQSGWWKLAKERNKEKEVTKETQRKRQRNGNERT